MRRLLHLLLIVVLIAPPLPAGAAVPPQRMAEQALVQRVALVIGNGAYQHLDGLPNPPADARAIAGALWNVGFEVIEVIDADLGQTLAAMTTFARRLRPGTEALFYYAGHAVQWNGANFLLPVSAQVGSSADLLSQAINAAAIVQVMENAGARLNLVILDSCRDNPFGDGIAEGSSGLAEMRGHSAEMVIGYATAPGAVASDGAGRHSPYTAALLEHLEEPGLEVSMLFRRVRSSVRVATDGQQIPWVSSSLENEFYFRPAEQPAIQLAALGASPTDTLGMLPPSVVVELAYWQSIKESRDPDRSRRVPRALPGRQLRRDRAAQARPAGQRRGGCRDRRGAGRSGGARRGRRRDRELHRRRPGAARPRPAGGPRRRPAARAARPPAVQRPGPARQRRDPGERRPADRQHAGRAALRAARRQPQRPRPLELQRARRRDRDRARRAQGRSQPASLRRARRPPARPQPGRHRRAHRARRHAGRDRRLPPRGRAVPRGPALCRAARPLLPRGRRLPGGAALARPRGQDRLLRSPGQHRQDVPVWARPAGRRRQGAAVVPSRIRAGRQLGLGQPRHHGA